MSFAWPGFSVRHFELRILPNQRAHVGPYAPTTQIIDLLGERWRGVIELPPTENKIEAAAREAFFDRLKGQAYTFALWHLRYDNPQGTMRGSPTVAANIAQLANTGTLQTTAGATLLAGDMIKFGGQLVRIMTNAVANGSGVISIEFQPRARVAISSGSAVTYYRPTADMMMTAPDGVATAYRPGYADGASFEFIEVPA